MLGRTTHQRIGFMIIDQQLNELLTGKVEQEEAGVEAGHNSSILNHGIWDFPYSENISMWVS